LKGEGTSDRFLVSEYDDNLQFVFLVVSIKVFSRNLICFSCPQNKNLNLRYIERLSKKSNNGDFSNFTCNEINNLQA
jgi:hypothetical protein